MTRLELYHHGIEGQKWGVRRYQYEDGSLTPAGKERYSSRQRKQDERLYGKRAADRIERRVNEGESVLSARHKEVVSKERKEKAKNVAKKVVKSTVVTTLVAAPFVLSYLAKKNMADSIVNFVTKNANAVNAGKTFVSTYLNI